MHRRTLNIKWKSTDSRARILSNFAFTPFYLDGKLFVSVEGFIQAIKFPPSDGRSITTRLMMGEEAKSMGKEAAIKYSCSYVWWNGTRIPYGSPEHHELIARAITAKIDQTPIVKESLISTKGYELTHNVGQVETLCTSLPEVVFIKILNDLREEYLRSENHEA